MNIQAHMSGQISGQVPNQAGSQLPGLPPQNGSSFPSQIQNLGAHRNIGNMDPDIVRARKRMQVKIYECITQRQSYPHDLQLKRVADIVRRLDDVLFRGAATKEDYANLDTLESRLHDLIKDLPLSSHNQQFPQAVNSSSTISTMIPTPGMSHSGTSNLMVTSSVDTSLISAPPGSGSSVGIHSGSFNSSDGSLCNGYQQSTSSFSIGSGGNNLLSSMSGQRITSQMIPTPGFNSNNNQTYMNSESSNNGGGFSSVESAMVSQPQQQKQHVVGQNSRILHNLGGQMGSRIRSGLPQKTYGFSNGALNGGFIGNNMQLVNGPSTSDGYLSSTLYGNSPKPLQQQFDQHQRSLIQGDGYGMNTSDPSGSANFYNTVTSVGSMMNTQNLNPVSLQSISKTNPALIPNQSNLHNAQQVVHMKPQPVNQSEKVNFQPPVSSRENLLQSHQQQQFLHQSHQFQQQFVPNQRQQKPPSQQHQIMVRNDAFVQPQLTSDLTSQVKAELGGEHHNKVLHAQVSDRFQLSEMQNQFQQNSSEDHSRGAQLHSLPSGRQDTCLSLPQNSQQMLHPQQLIAESQNDFCCGLRNLKMLLAAYLLEDDQNEYYMVP